MRDSRPATIRRLLPATVAALIFLAMAALYATGRRAVYETILRGFGVDPFAYPFLDTETVLSAVRCLRTGFDVFVSNPCDPLRRVYDYSPLWLLLAKLPVTEAWRTPAGLFVDVSFIASLILLPAGRNAAATALIALGVVSSAVVFGVERGNNDLVLFTLAAVAATLVCRTPGARVAGYAAALLAGLLKYYPMTLLALATRERPSRFWAVVVGTTAVAALFVATMGHDLSRALRLIPEGGWFGDMFGSGTLPGGLAQLGWASLSTVLRIGLPVASIGAGVLLGLRPGMAASLDRLTDRERSALLAGSLLILGCFFTARNIGYRATHLLLTLPALTALWRLRAGRLWPLATCAVLLLLWSQGWRNAIAIAVGGRPAFLTFWLMREMLWWWMVAVLAAIVVNLLARSAMGRRLVEPT